MEEDPGVNEQYRRASPWPLFVAVGLALSEVGVFLDIPQLSVGGLLLLSASVVGILHETEYVTRPWRLSVLFSIGLVALGVLLDAVIPVPVGFRGKAIAIAGGLLLVGTGVAWLRSEGRI